ncbi:putative digeranylgeranylglyceryl phosphate synthase protein [Penicillium brasilianum]|uniref:Putative digeranylgeranylglyceryl phosphate synthase protein n=1 Tax=Penicillium brasilianum TaxID=104259 RepID=A0A1S9RDQ3_PENBI|nr:putative digeranylgeranylglyceryl phosphate synthase protein [Penicillium brasilianum]
MQKESPGRVDQTRLTSSRSEDIHHLFTPHHAAMSPPEAMSLSTLLHLIWHFTESNVPTFVLPNSAFGLLAALAAPLLTNCSERPSSQILLGRTPRVVFFNWANVFVFDLANQRLPESRLEDRLNKPWRPLPTGRISPETTRRWMLVTIPFVLCVSAILGVATESAFIIILTWLYNDLHGGDEIIRDGIIACGYALYLTGSMRIACGLDCHISEHGYRWIAMMSGIIVTTMQVQDLKDQIGDRTRGRKTLPLVLGDTVSRWTIAGFTLFWSILCSYFWRMSLWGYALPMLTGIGVAFDVVSGSHDARAWRCWCAWQVVVYALPWFVSTHY